MIAHIRVLLGTLMLLPAIASAAEPVRPSFHLQDAAMRQIVQQAARVQRIGLRLERTPPLTVEIPATRVAAAMDLEMSSLRRPARIECREFDCVAYDELGKAMYTTPAPPTSFHVPDRTEAGWLKCQSTNNLLSTFERFEKCT